RGGSVSEAGLIADDVAGTVTMRLPVISADLRGTAFGGPVEATGVVNVDARRWEANATAQPALAEAADWLALAPYPDGLPLELTGRAALALRVTGWEDFTLDGTASGEGAVEGVPLDDLDVSFRRPADGGLRANGAARLGDGPVEFTIAPGQRGDRLTLNAQGVSLEALQSGLGTVTATVDVGMGSGGNGTIRADWRGE